MEMQLNTLFLCLVDDLDLVDSRDRAGVDNGISSEFIELYITGNDDSRAFFDIGKNLAVLD